MTRVALGACVALGALTPASAGHSWGNYHWARTSNPLVLKINEALTLNWEPYLKTAMDDWTTSTVLDFSSAEPVESSNSAKRCSPIPGQVLVCNAAYGQRGWLGIASIWASGSHITQATTKVNDSYFNYAPYNTPAWRQFVMCQEIGHDFGLAHQDEGFSNTNLGSCMDYTNTPAGGTAGSANGTLANTAPNKHDYDQLVAIYGGHTDPSNSATTSPAATNFGVREVGKPAAKAGGYAGAGDTMAEWGRAIHHDGKGRPDIFVRQLSDGTKMISHVLWAPDAKGTEAH